MRYCKSQQGYILILIMVLMAIMAIASVQFTARTSGSLKTFSQTRDANQSLLIAESALNTLYAHFAYNADLNQDGTPDNSAPINMATTPPGINLPYLYYFANNSTIGQQQPGILQSIATNEAQANPISSNNAPGFNPNQALRIDNLYSNNAGPLTYQQNENGLLIRSQLTWTQINASKGKAIAWLEAVRDKNNDSIIKIYVQAVGEYQSSRSYVQRFAGSYSQTIGGPLCALCESNTQTTRPTKRGEHS